MGEETEAEGTSLYMRMDCAYLRAPFNVVVCNFANKVQAAEAVVAHVLARDARA